MNPNVEDIGNSISELSPVRDDPYLTDQQSKRDELVTQLLTSYIGAYEYKVDARKEYQKALFRVCLGIVIIFSVALVILAFKLWSLSSESISNIASIITACVSFLVLIVELLKIITRYCFPEDDEQYITDIVKAIQSNDLDNKKLNMGGRRTASDSSDLSNITQSNNSDFLSDETFLTI